MSRRRVASKRQRNDALALRLVAVKLRTTILLAGLVTMAVPSSSAIANPLGVPVVGPSLICFKYSTFALIEGEQVTAFSGGPEEMSIEISGPSGNYEVSESEIFAATKASKRRVLSRDETRVYRVSSGNEVRYAIYGPTDFSDGKDHLLIWLSGNALRGTRKDASIYSRFEVKDPATVNCSRTFTYSWEFLLPDSEQPASNR